jgi:hypothetical protein
VNQPPLPSHARVRPAGQSLASLVGSVFGFAPGPNAGKTLTQMFAGGGSGGSTACALPTSPVQGQTRTDASGQSVTAQDPYFASSAERAAWITAHPSCPVPPAFIPDAPVLPVNSLVVLGVDLGAVWMGLPIWAWGLIGLGSVAAIGTGVAMLMPKAKGSSKRSSRASRRANPSRRRRRRHRRAA